MKKIKDYAILGLAATAMAFMMTSCEDDITTENQTDNTEVVAEEKVPEKEPESAWNQVDYVDEFGDPTGESTVTQLVMDGKFSNSATTNSPLAVKLVQVDGGLLVELHDYQNPEVTTFGYENSFGKIQVKYPNGTKESVEIFSSETLGLFISDDKPLFDSIMTEGRNAEIAFHIDGSKFSKYESSTYDFKVMTR